MAGHIQLPYHQIGTIFDFLSTGIIVISTDRRVLAMNQTAELLTGRPADAVIGTPCSEAFADYLCHGDCAIDDALNRDQPAVARQIDVISAEGENRRILKIVSPLVDDRQQMTGCVEIFQDISAFEELVEQVGEESRKLKRLLDHLDVGIFSCGRGGHITFFNTTAETITGYAREDVLGKHCEHVFGRAFCERLMAASDHTAATAEAVEQTIQTGSGQQLPVKARHIPILGRDRTITSYLTTITDLSLVYQYKSALSGRYTFHNMISKDPGMQQIFSIVPSVAESDATVLIEGPTGSGKDLLANVIHNASKRANRPMIKVNCAALPDSLLESELFGYAKGAFTGADQDKPGRFQDADGGTLFLDEIGDLPLPLQAKLLRVIEDKQFYPLGSRRTTSVDVRIISATNRRLQSLVAEKQFRADLFYRLNVMRLDLPPLKERRGDLPLLIDHLLKRLSQVNNVDIESVDEAAMTILLNYDYPGNVRELENILSHALIVCRDRVITAAHLPIHLQQWHAAPETGEPPAPVPPSATDAPPSEKSRILASLEHHNWHKTRTARSLGIDRSTLWRKMKKYRILP